MLCRDRCEVVVMFGSLRILLVHPHIQLFGGSEVLTRILVNELSTLGHENCSPK